VLATNGKALHEPLDGRKAGLPSATGAADDGTIRIAPRGDRDLGTSPWYCGAATKDAARIMETGRQGPFAWLRYCRATYRAKLTDCAVFVGAKGAWASLPVKPQLYRDGRQRSGADSKPSYVPILEWRSRGLAERWSKSVVDLVRQRRPAALGDDVS
jgi:hypothetical protein